MQMYSYLVDHDYGLAPNPFGKFCTLVVCKPSIRKSNNLSIGDWIIGTGSKSLEKFTGRKLVGRLIYAMQVSERLTLEDYWSDSRFQYKKPIMNGSRVAMNGDNFYHKDDAGKWIQEDSAHRKVDGTCNIGHLENDISGKNALISEYFFYFGNNAPEIPAEFINVCYTTQGQKIVRPPELMTAFIDWISSNWKMGIQGTPLNWSDSNQLRLF